MEVTRYLGSHLGDVLTNSRLKISRVSQFNDPFEFRYKCVGEITRKVVEDFMQERLKREGFIQQLRNMNEFRGKNKKEIKQHYQENKVEIIDKLLDSMPVAHRQLLDGVVEKAEETLRVICFSRHTQSELNELLLWSPWLLGTQVQHSVRY